MTVQTTALRGDYTGNGVTVDFAVPFYFLENSHVQIEKLDTLTNVTTTLALTTDYTLAGAGVLTGGTATLLVAPLSTDKIAITRNVPYTQQTHYVEGDPFPSQSHEAALDKLTMLAQQLDEESSRSVKAPASAAGFDGELPNMLPSYLVGTNAAGTGFELVAPSSGSAAELAVDLADTTSAVKGASKIGFNAALDYLVNTVGDALKTCLAFITNLAASSGSSLVGFIQSGTGAVARTVLDKGRETVSVADFGAVGDGVADDAAAIQAAINALPASVSIQDPSRYGTGGGTVKCKHGLVYKVSAPIVLTHGVTLDLNGSTLRAVGNIDVIQIDYKYAELANKTTERVAVINGAIDGSAAAESGITNRKPAGITYALENCRFENLQIYGCKTQMHIFAGWNNTFRNISARAADYNSATEEGMFGIICETMTAGGTYGPAGKTVTASAWGGGFNNNIFDTVVAVFLKRCGVHIRAISQAHAINNKFINCNFEQINKQASGLDYAPYTDLTATPDGTDPITGLAYTVQTLKWSGEAIGLHLLGRIYGHSVDTCYLEAIADTGGTTGGTGVLLDDCGIMFNASTSKCNANTVQSCFFNSNVERTVHAARCIYTAIKDSMVLLSAGARKGHLVEATALRTTLTNEILVNVNSSSGGFDYLSCAGQSGQGSPKVRSTAGYTWMGSNPAIDVYRDGSDANFSAIRFRNGTNAATNAQIGCNSSQLRLEGTTNIVSVIGGNTRTTLNDTQFYPGTDNTMSCGIAGNRWSVVYAGTGTIDTSDARLKQDIRDITEAEARVATKIKGILKAYRFRDSVAEKGDAARIHFGVVAQEVGEAFRSEGLNPEHYALYCYDEWDDQYEELEDGTKRLIVAAGDRFGIRYDELLAFILSVD